MRTPLTDRFAEFKPRDEIMSHPMCTSGVGVASFQQPAVVVSRRKSRLSRWLGGVRGGPVEVDARDGT
jgi:hypothetical protein